MEEQHDQEEEYVEEQPVPLQSKPITINKKTGLPRKVLDEAALSKLAKAREKANAIREENRLKKLEQKVKDMKIKKNIKEEVKENELKEEVKENELKEEPEQPKEEEPEEEEPPKIIKKKIKKKKPVVIVEQSSDDEDEFEANDKVLFVKRVSRKKKEKEPEAPRSEPTQEYELPPPDIPKPPIKQKPTLLEQQYHAMFSGQFLNNQRRRF